MALKLICVFVFAYAKSRFSHDAAHFEFATRAGCSKRFVKVSQMLQKHCYFLLEKCENLVNSAYTLTELTS